MKRLLFGISLLAYIVYAEAGSFSSGSSSRSYSGGGGRSFSSSSRSSSTPRASVTTRRYSSRVTTTNHYYGNFGSGYAYNNGFLTGMIIGSWMHPMGTVMYMGPGAYYNNAFLYPNGQVVSSSGVLVGTYVGGVFNPIVGGSVVAQQVPQDAVVQEPSPPPPQPVVVQNTVGDAGVLFFTLTVLMCFVAFFIILIS